MRKSCLLLCLMLVLSVFHAIPAAACWMEPEPFEILSAEGSKVFVFTPTAGNHNANAAVYEIMDNERRLVYTLADLSSFAYESNFHFSTDMMHFARIFPPYGMYAFEVFSYGIRTRVVLRSDFIADYASIEAYSSIGPFYTVTWRIDAQSAQNGTITIHTDEDSAVLFDLATASFHHEVPDEILPEPTFPIQNTPTMDSLPAPSPDPGSRTQHSFIVIGGIAGTAVAVIAVGVFLLRKRKRAK